MYKIKTVSTENNLFLAKILTKCIYWLSYCKFFRKILSQCTYSYLPAFFFLILDGVYF